MVLHFSRSPLRIKTLTPLRLVSLYFSTYIRKWDPALTIFRLLLRQKYKFEKMNLKVPNYNLRCKWYAV